MALLGNYSVLTKNPGRFFSGATLPQVRVNVTSGALRNRFLNTESAAINDEVSLPSGYTSGYAYSLAQSTPNLASYTKLRSVTTVNNANCQAGYYIDSSVVISGTIDNAELSLVAFMLANITASGSVNAAAELTSEISASVSVAGNVALANVINGTVNSDVSITLTSDFTASGSLSIARSAALSGSSTMTGTITNGSAFSPANLSGTGTFTGNITALAGVAATILPFTELSPESLANAVWNEPLTDKNTVNSAGKTIKQIKALTTAGL